MTPAPLTPATKALKRVLSLSKLNGWSILLIAGTGALVSLLTGDLASAGTGALAAGTGWLELRGRSRLVQRDISGMKLMARAELLLLAVIAAYCVSRLASFDASYLKEQAIPELRQNLLLLGISLEDLLKGFDLKVDDLIPLVRLAFTLLYGGVLLVSLIYQGGMAFWYHRRASLVEAALNATTAVPQNPSTAPPRLG